MVFPIQILDINNTVEYHGFYKVPVIHIYGVGNKNIEIRGFMPYFYCRVHPDYESSFLDTLNFLNIKYDVENKYRPIGYQTKTVEVFKILAEDPRDIRALRTQVKGIPGVLEIYEADVLFKNRFLINRGLYGMGYCDENGYYLDKQGNEDLKILGFDIEVLPPANGEMPKSENPADKVILITFAFSHEFNGKKTLVLVLGNGTNYDDVMFFRDEKLLLNYFNEVFHYYDPDVVTGYNINGFDFEYLAVREKLHQLVPIIGRNNTKLWIKKGFQNTTISVTGRVIFDLLPLVKANYNYSSYTLKNIAHEMLKNDKIELGMQQMRTEYLNGDYKNTIEYGRHDAVLALELLYKTKFLDKYIAISNVTGLLLQDCVNSGQSQKVEMLTMRRFLVRNRLMAMRPDDAYTEVEENGKVGYGGAEVLLPKKGMLKDVVVLDYKSLYPTIIISQNYSPDTIILENDKERYQDVPSHQAVVGGLFVDRSVMVGVFPEILEELLNERIRIKRLMKKAEGDEREYLDARQYALKILLNSFYGYTGFSKARLFVVDIAQAVTSFGRQNIMETKKFIENYSHDNFKFDVIYGDTDSVFIECKHPDFKYGEIPLDTLRDVGIVLGAERSKQLPAPMELLYEKIAKSIVFEAKKKYAYLNFEQNKNGVWESKIKASGIETKRRDWCSIVGSTLSKCLESVLIRDNTNEAIISIKESIDRIENMKYQSVDDLKDIILTKKYARNVDSYKIVPIHIRVAKKMIERREQLNIGDRISYVIISGDGDFNTRAENANKVVSEQIEIDREYYIEKQLLPAIDRFMGPLGIKRSKYYNGLNGNKNDRIVIAKTGKKELQKSLFSYE
jgi:DNA polymerase I